MKFRYLVSATFSLLLSAIALSCQGAWPVELSMCRVTGGQAVVVGANDKEVLCATVSHLSPAVGESIIVQWPSGKSDTGKVLKLDQRQHLAAFSVRTTAPHLPFIIDGLRPDDDLTLDAGSLSAANEIQGFRSRFLRLNGPTTFWLAGRNKPGQSGGPVYERSRGSIVGLQAAHNAKQPETLAVTGQTLRSFLAEFVGGTVQVDHKTLDGALDDPDVQLTCGRFCQRLVPQKFNFASHQSVSSSSSSNNLELAFQLDTLIAQVQLLEDQVLTLQQQPGEPGPAGPQGPAGADGQDGADGTDAVVDYDKIWDWITAHYPQPEDGTDGQDGEDGTPALVDYDKIWQWILDHKDDLVVEPTIPLVVNYLDGEGNVAGTQPVQDGQINIPPVKAWWTRLDGQTVKQARPLGTPLKFETEVRQAKSSKSHY